MSDPALSSAFAALLERAVNSALVYDPGSRAKLSKLHNSVIHCQCHKPDLNLYFSFNEDEPTIRIHAHFEGEVHTTLSGDLFDVLVLLLTTNSGSTSSLANSGLSLFGNSSKLATLQSILQQLDIDWEQALNDLSSPLGETGKVASHQVANVIKHVIAWKQGIRNSVKNNVADYLSEELRAIPAKAELHDFYDGVSSLRADVDRLYARVQAHLYRADKQQ